MVQKNEVLTREDNRVSLSAARRVAVQQHYPAHREREMPTNAAVQIWTFEVGEVTGLGRTILRLLNTFLKIVNWLNHVGAGKVDDRHLQSRHNIRQNFRAKGIGL
jgi:hypothetical protein